MKTALKNEYTPSEYEMSMFKEMEGKYVSANEQLFFERMLRKIQTEYASMNEVIIDYKENPDGVYLYREMYDDFEIGREAAEIEDNPVMTNGLFGILTLDLSQFKTFPVHKTLLEWLRSTDYRYVHYDNWEG